MTLTFYINTSDPNTVTKNLQSLGDITGVTMRSEMEVRTPVFTVASQALPTDFNYCYCDWTKRFYYVQDITALRNGVYEIACRCDVLQTFADYIRAQTATIARNENVANGYLIDAEYQAYSYEEIVTKQFPNAMEEDSVILMTVG